jgi:hypothetical protein
MDITQFNTKDKANEGQWVPITLYGKEADFDLLILGDDSDVVQKFERAASKKLANMINKVMSAGKQEAATTNDKPSETDDDQYEEGVLVRINGIRGWKVKRDGDKEVSRNPDPVVLNGKTLASNEESYKLLITKIPAIKEIVMKYARDRNNFLAQPSRN